MAITEYSCDILIIGGSAGGTAAALAAADRGAQVCLIEVTNWLGGQLTSQGVCTPEVVTALTILFTPRSVASTGLSGDTNLAVVRGRHSLGAFARAEARSFAASAPSTRVRATITVGLRKACLGGDGSQLGQTRGAGEDCSSEVAPGGKIGSFPSRGGARHQAGSVIGTDSGRRT